METKNKRGISLIVLVITIIVMIILATAIILSLNNSGIMDKANKAKNDSDTATIKEYVNTLKLDWEFMTAEEKEEYGTTTFIDYANKKIMESGYKDVALDVNGELYLGLTENVREAIVAGIKIGDEVAGYTLDSNKKNISSELASIITIDNYSHNEMQVAFQKWRYIGISENGELMIVPDIEPVNSEVKKFGFRVEGLYDATLFDRVCEELYSVSGVGKARSMNIDDVNKILQYVGPKGGYTRVDSGGIEIPTEEALTIGFLIEHGNEDDIPDGANRTPDGKDIYTYLADYYKIPSNSDYITEDSVRKSIVFQEYPYYLSSFSNLVVFGQFVEFGLRVVEPNEVSRFGCASSYAADSMSCGSFYSFRPVISLNADVELTAPETSGGAWTIK